MDSELQNDADASALAYVSGGTKTIGKEKINYKTSVLYTEFIPPTYINNKGKKATGKIIVGLSSGKEQPVVSKNKVVKDTETAKLASISYKKVKREDNTYYGKITVTAKKPGIVYAWVFALTTTDQIQSFGFVPVVLKAAPTKVIFQDSACTDGMVTDQFQAITAKTVQLNTTFDIYLNPTVTETGKKRKTVTENTFSIQVPNASEEYIKVESTSNPYKFTIIPLALKNEKATKITLKAVCGENGTSAKLSVTIRNGVKKMNFQKKDETDSSFTVLDQDNQRLNVTLTNGTSMAPHLAILKENVVLYRLNTKNLDGTTIYQLPSAEGFSITEAGKVKVEKGITKEQKKVTMKLVKKTQDEYQITAKAGLSTGLTAYFLVVHNGLGGQGAGWRVIEVRIG